VSLLAIKKPWILNLVRSDPYRNHPGVEVFLSAMLTSPVAHTVMETFHCLRGRVIARSVTALGLKAHTFLANTGIRDHRNLRLLGIRRGNGYRNETVCNQLSVLRSEKKGTRHRRVHEKMAALAPEQILGYAVGIVMVYLLDERCGNEQAVLTATTNGSRPAGFTT
jgi:hypothetical protein